MGTKHITWHQSEFSNASLCPLEVPTSGADSSLSGLIPINKTIIKIKTTAQHEHEPSRAEAREGLFFKIFFGMFHGRSNTLNVYSPKVSAAGLQVQSPPVKPLRTGQTSCVQNAKPNRA